MNSSQGTEQPPTPFKRYADAVAKLRVPCGFALLLLFGWLSHPSLKSLAAGIPVALSGLALRAWATGHLEKNLNLTRSGPYAFVRNPLYLGTSLAAAGFVIASQRWILATAFAAVFLLVYLPVIKLEEQHLRNLFPEFADYAKHVPGLFPAFRPVQDTKSFQWSLYRKNREYEAALGFIAGVLFLAGKLLLESST